MVRPSEGEGNDAATINRAAPPGIPAAHRTPPFIVRPVPFRSVDPAAVKVSAASEALGMPLVHDASHGLWALGAVSGGRALRSAIAPELELPDFRGAPFRLSSLRGTKVLLVAWASW